MPEPTSGIALARGTSDLWIAVTSLIVFIIVVLTRPRNRTTRTLWILTFAFLTITSLLGYCSHSYQWNPAMDKILRCVMFAFMFSTVYIFSESVAYTHFGSTEPNKTLRKAFQASGVILFVFVAVTETVFSVNCILVYMVYALACWIRCFVDTIGAMRSNRSGRIALLISMGCLILSILSQVLRDTRINDLFVFDLTVASHVLIALSLLSLCVSAVASIRSCEATSRHTVRHADVTTPENLL